MSSKQTGRKKIDARLASGEITEQKSWKFIRELNSYSEERLDALALTGGRRDYSYRQMFRHWDRYAEVFSALHITDRDHARVGMVSVAAVEPVLAFYALNMTGASVSMVHILDLLDEDRWEKLVRKERITDVILCDQVLQPETLNKVLRSKDRLGLRNVIVLHNDIGGSSAPQGMGFLSNLNYLALKRCSGALFMDELLRQYEATPIVYGSAPSDDDALIIHTSGTTSGIHKPIPLSDRGFNEAVARLLRDERFTDLRETAVSYLAIELASSYGVVDMMHLTFAFSGTLVTLPIPPFHPQYAQSAKKYGVNVLFATSVMLDWCIKSREKLDLSDLSFVFLGGGYVSAEAKKRYNEFLRSCGAKNGASNGYGLSEVGGACILSDPDREDDSIGYPLSGVKVKIYDEDEERFYTLEDGPRTGVLFLSTPSMSCGRIDSEVFFELDEIDGEPYLNTYDLVTVNEDGSMTCIGRMNKYFVNNEGIRFDAGLVETAVAAQPGIEACSLAPVFDKMIHDTVPALYVQTTGNQAFALQTVRQALYNVFIRDNKISETNLPGQCVLTTRIPYTAMGKVDVYSILKGDTPGVRYKVTPIRQQGKLMDVRLDPAHDEAMGMWAGAPDELDVDPDFINRILGSDPMNSGSDSGRPSFMPGMDPGKIFDLLRSFLSWPDQGGPNGQTPFGQPGMGCQGPQMARQDPWGQAGPFQQPGMGCQGPQMAQQDPWGQGPFRQPPCMGWQPPCMARQDPWAQSGPFRQSPNMGCQANGRGPAGQPFPDPGKIMDLLAVLFNASTFSSFYEE